MKINNKQFGEVNFEEDSIIYFEDGLLGFEEFKKFVLITEEEGFFLWLTAIDNPELIFPLFSIKMLQEQKENSSEDTSEPFGIVKLDQDPEKISINLKAPVFIDQENKTGYQTIVENEDYPVEYPLFEKN
ncbi:MAG: flagellar biosynthesis protein FliW [Ignavibacteriae bacterium]|nr:MAG: flagellar biosynthesis protein FliW [Ignavibacteriota bacterium]